MRCVLLNPGLDGCRTAYLRAPCGADELAGDDGAIAVLDRLLVQLGPGAVPPGSAARLPVSDRDRLLACLYRDLFGDQIEADATCKGCDTPFAVRFSLSGLIDGQRPWCPDGIAGPDAAGHYRLHGVTFRLPSTADLDAVAALPAEERRTALLASCVVVGDASGHDDSIEGAMAALAPALDVDLDARCPHCDAATLLHFNITSFFLKSLGNERRFLLREAHRIARAYGWSCAEIMALPRAVRQDFVRLIDSETTPGRRPMAAAGLA
jgi:hypothetical protein